MIIIGDINTNKVLEILFETTTTEEKFNRLNFWKKQGYSNAQLIFGAKIQSEARK